MAKRTKPAAGPSDDNARRADEPSSLPPHPALFADPIREEQKAAAVRYFLLHGIYEDEVIFTLLGFLTYTGNLYEECDRILNAWRDSQPKAAEPADHPWGNADPDTLYLLDKLAELVGIGEDDEKGRERLRGTLRRWENKHRTDFHRSSAGHMYPIGKVWEVIKKHRTKIQESSK
jgi:hypothetical protein